MTLDQAKKIVGSQPKYAIRNMRKALEMLNLLNTEEEWARLEACYVILKTPVTKRINYGTTHG